ncbi:15940_t:CDS:2 [Gigaspora margarita]|uniref:15940_t:CDS:1 n=1 Tax=Gigaspora margarita TaxID=4874 RepID=A0ABN7VVU5_GIGMA|nr:15940_t:CDS:2 [Gigaspora margarita]
MDNICEIIPSTRKKDKININGYLMLTSETVAQVLQVAITNSPQYVYQYLPSPDAIHQTIQRIHHIDLPMEPSSLEYLVISEHMMKTLNGINFLIYDYALEWDVQDDTKYV